MLRVIKAFFPAVLLAYLLASSLATQSVLASVASFGLPVDPLVRLQTTLQDLAGMSTSYLPLILVAFLLGLPVAAALARALPARRALLFSLAGFAAIVALHLIMHALLGVYGIAAARTLPGLLGQGLAGAAGGFCYHRLSRVSMATRAASIT
jgi:hypothetical protein